MTTSTNGPFSPFEKLLAEIFPPRIPRFRIKWIGGIEDDVQGDGIVCGPMYDVRADGIEKHAWEEETYETCSAR